MAAPGKTSAVRDGPAKPSNGAGGQSFDVKGWQLENLGWIGEFEPNLNNKPRTGHTKPPQLYEATARPIGCLMDVRFSQIASDCR
jgi:hypothetical protein